MSSGGMASLEPFDASRVIARGLVVQWARGHARGPFERPHHPGYDDHVLWNRDASKLWTETRRGWIQWDALTGAWLRRVARPDDVEPPLLEPELRRALQAPDGGPITRTVVAFASD